MSIIAVDFDGTLCVGEWPDIGRENRPIINQLIRHRAEGGKVILWTCRSGEMLDAAVLWCRNRGLEFDAINDNLPENIEAYGNNCRKVWADEYWDDKSVIVYAGSNPSLLSKNGDGGYRTVHWDRTRLTVLKPPLITRIKRWIRRCH